MEGRAMSSLWINIRFWNDWFLQIGPDTPYVLIGRNHYYGYKTKFDIYRFFKYEKDHTDGQR